jgi:hypothetical protein
MPHCNNFSNSSPHGDFLIQITAGLLPLTASAMVGEESLPHKRCVEMANEKPMADLVDEIPDAELDSILDWYDQALANGQVYIISSLLLPSSLLGF